MLANARWAQQDEGVRPHQTLLRDSDFERTMLKVHATNRTMLLEKIVVSLGYTRIRAGKEWGVTAYAMDLNNSVVLLVVEPCQVRMRIQEDVRMPYEGYPSPRMSEWRVRTLRNSAAAFLYDHPEFNSVRVDYIAIPETVTAEQARSSVPITMKRGLTWRVGSVTDVGRRAE